MTKAPAHHTAPEHPPQQGFILLFVLLTIAAISIIAISSYNALSRSSAYTAALRDNARTDKALASAEAEAIYFFLTAVSDTNSMRTAPAGGIETIFTSVTESGDQSPLTHWQANGAIRQSVHENIKILVSYRDSSGFAPVNSLPEEDIVRLFVFAGFARPDAEKLAAELGDFMDTDHERRFRGGERADYRLYQKPTPTNSPLRNSVEIANLLSIPPELGSKFWQNLTEATTLYTRPTTLNANFALPALRTAFDLEEALRNTSGIEQALLNNSHPSDRARFLLVTPVQNGVSRAVEIEKSVNDTQKPFRRYLISQRRGVAGLYETGLQNIIGLRGGRQSGDENAPDSDGINPDLNQPRDPPPLPNSQSDTQPDNQSQDDQDQKTGDTLNDYPFIFSPTPQDN